MLVRLPYQSEMAKLRIANGAAAPPKEFYWQLVPFYTKLNNDPPLAALMNFEEQSMGENYRIGKCAEIYGESLNPHAARAVARKFVYTAGHHDDSHKKDIKKLRQLEIEVNAG
jgi:hypothetical protein